MLQVLGRITSINVRKVLWTCHELGREYELQAWGNGDLKLDAPEFASLNPNRLIPVLRDGDFVLWESNAICRYLVAAAGREDLLPVAPRARAVVEQWMDWQATELNEAYVYAFLGLVRHDPRYQDRARIAASLASWQRQMSIVESQLQRTGAFIAGAAFTVADIVIGLTAHRWFLTPAERVSLPAVEEYYRRLCERPTFAAHGSVGIA